MSKYDILEKITSPILEDDDKIIEIMKPIGKSIIEQPKKINNNMVICDVCGVKYHRNNVSNHRKTKVHKLTDEYNKKLLRLIHTSK